MQKTPQLLGAVPRQRVFNRHRAAQALDIIQAVGPRNPAQRGFEPNQSMEMVPCHQ